jgi:excisionase family DNA binding protein
VRLLTAAEVAEQLHLPVSWVYAAARDGRLPAVKCGRYTRFDGADIRAWIEDQKPARNGAPVTERSDG